MGSLTRRSARHVTPFTATAKVTSASRVSTAGLGYIEYGLRVGQSEFSGFHWDEAGRVRQPVPTGSQVRLIGTLAKGAQRNRIRIDQLSVLPSSETPSGMLEVLSHCKHTGLADRVVAWIDGLCPLLRHLVTDVLSAQDIGRRFVTFPASRGHHHTEQGGLLVHCMECVDFVRGAATTALSPRELDLTMVAAFLHDVGKIWTLTPDQKLSDLGHAVPHDVLTLEVLAPYMKRLDSKWPVGARHLRHLLTWTPAQSRYPEFPGTLLVRAADQFSTSTYLRRAVFANCPDYFWKGHSQVAGGQSFLRVPVQ